MANQNDQGYELSSLAADGLPNDNHDARAEFSLPRADGGRQAWAFLLAAFVAEALVYEDLVTSNTCATLNKS